MAVLGPDLSARCGHQPPADTGQPVGRTQQTAQTFVVPCLPQMGQPVPHHDMPSAPSTGLVKDAVHGLDAAAVMCPGPEGPHVKAVWSTPIAYQAASQHDPHTRLRFRSPPPEVFEDTVLENDGLAAFNVQFIRIPGAAQHQLTRAPDDTASKNGTAAPGHAHGLIQLIQRASRQVDEAILHQPVLPVAHIQAMPTRVRNGDGLSRQAIRHSPQPPRSRRHPRQKGA